MYKKWLSGMMGLVVGDALGVPVEFLSREQIKNRNIGEFLEPVVGMEYNGTYKMPIGTWSDDSSMALATLASIIDNDGLVPEHMMENFIEWESNGKFTPFGNVFDIGITCHRAIENYKKNADILTCGMSDEYSNGNGSLMRVLPVCLYYYDKQRETSEDITNDIIEGIGLISGLTHSHIRSKIACGLYYFMCKSILESRENSKLESILQKGIDDGIEFYKQKLVKNNEMAHYGRIVNLTEFKKLFECEIKSSGYVVDSLEAAIWCLLNTNSYKECLLKAVNLGMDTDTVAAIAGGLAGLYYGYDNIPAEWIEVIQKRDWLINMFETADSSL